jgi:hypothetical protein
MTKANTSKKMSKADFVRKLPPTMPAVAIVEKAKAAGLKLSTNYIYRVRTAINAKSRPPNAPTKSASVAAASRTPTTTKAAFVRALPATTPAKEVIAKAKAAGFSVSKTYVYLVRGTTKGPAKKRPAAKATTSKPASTGAPPPAGKSSDAESLLKAVAGELGLGHAITLLQAERARVRSILSG